MMNKILSIKPKLLCSIEPGKNTNGNQTLNFKKRVNRIRCY